MTSISPPLEKRTISTYVTPLLSLCVLIVTYYLAIHPNSHGPACLFRAATGIPCPGCGLTRSLSSIWRGDVLLSVRFHPLGIPLFIVCIGCILFCMSDHIFPRLSRNTLRVRAQFTKNATLGSIAAMMVTLWVVRLVLWKTGPHFFMW